MSIGKRIKSIIKKEIESAISDSQKDKKNEAAMRFQDSLAKTQAARSNTVTPSHRAPVTASGGPTVINHNRLGTVTPPAITAPKKPAVDWSAALFGNDSEVVLDLADANKKFAIALYKDGVWERRDTTIGTFVFKRAEGKMPYVTKECVPSFTMKLPRVPAGVLNATVDFFRLIMKDMRNSESMVQIYYDLEDKKYFLYVPEQRVSGASIRFEHSEELQSNPAKYLWVVDIHSHNTMGAFFSGGDDRDEKSTRLFGVLGNLQNENYGSKWRAGCNGNYFNLEIDDIFDLEAECTEEQIKEWAIGEEDRQKVKEYSVAMASDSWRQKNQQANSSTTYRPQVNNVNRGTGNFQSWQRGRYQGPSNPNFQRGGSMPWEGMYTGYGYGGYDDEDWEKWTGGASHRGSQSGSEILEYNDRDFTFDAQRGLAQFIVDVQESLKEGPTYLQTSENFGSISAASKFDNSTQVLLNILNVVLEGVNGDIAYDLESADPEVADLDLEDICFAFGRLLKQLPEPEMKVGWILSELNLSREDVEFEFDEEEFEEDEFTGAKFSLEEEDDGEVVIDLDSLDANMDRALAEKLGYKDIEEE